MTDAPVREVDTRKAPPLWSDDQLRDIKTLDDLAVALSGREDVKVFDASEFGNGYEVLDKEGKDKLIGVYFAIMDWRFNDGDQGEFVSVTVLTEKGDRYVINDGSTGICEQLREIQKAAGGTAVIRVKKGLRVSRYTYTDEKDGKEKPAATYYLSF